MGNQNSSNCSQEKQLSQAEVNQLLNEQRSLYEKKCQEYLQQAAWSAQAAARSVLNAQAAENALTAHKNAQEARNTQIPARRAKNAQADEDALRAHKSTQEAQNAQVPARRAKNAQADEDALRAHKNAQEARNTQIPDRRAKNAQADEDALRAHKSAQEAQNAQIPARCTQNASVATAIVSQVVPPRYNADPGVYKQQPEFKPQHIYVQPPRIFVQSSTQQGLSGYKSEKQRSTLTTNTINPSEPNLYPNCNSATKSFPTLNNQNSNKNSTVNDNVTVPSPRNVANKNLNCVTCKSLFGLQIFQCNRSHNSCDSCKEQGRSCGICRNVITSVRNNALESYITKKKVQCPHTSNGCILIIKISEMNNHAKECPFKELQCPSECSWKGYLPQLCSHFDTMHPQQRTAKLDCEMQLQGISKSSHNNYLILIGNLNFLFHIKVSTADCKIYITVQLISTEQSASKWTYEVHIYNKRQPRRKFACIDSCTSYFEPVANIFREGRCCVLPHGYASTFANNDVLSYKIFIHKIDKYRQRSNIDQN